jgi:hypothetical protein
MTNVAAASPWRQDVVTVVMVSYDVRARSGRRG